MKPVRQKRQRPRRVKLDDLSQVYVAAKYASRPERTGLPPAEWWRLLIVMAYATGLRRSDLFSITWEDIDFEDGTLEIDPSKTGKGDVFPLTTWALEHLRRAQRPCPTLFEARSYRRSCKRFTDVWRALIAAAGVPCFKLHARTLERYRIDSPKPREKMRVPVGFKSGPNLTERSANKKAAEAEKLRLQPSDFDTPLGTDPKLWRFVDVGFQYRMLGLKRMVVTASGPVTNSELRALNRKAELAGPEASNGGRSGTAEEPSAGTDGARDVGPAAVPPTARSGSPLADGK